MIELINLGKKYGERSVFENFNEKINTGEFVIFTGNSGCGKTTLLNMIGGLEKPDEGVVLVDGVNLYSGKKISDYFKHEVGFLFQNFALVENKTVKQNLNMVQKKQRTEHTISQVLRQVGLEEMENVPVYKLSGGEQQRVALARLILKKCEIILADEPTGSLDRDNAGRVIGLLKEMNKNGKTIVLVTHDERVTREIGRVIEL